jgi:ubiquitin-activating enzyme E1
MPRGTGGPAPRDQPPPPPPPFLLLHPSHGLPCLGSPCGPSQEAPKDDIDTALYSRQLYTIGKEAMLRMQRYSVLVVGLGGLGVELSKSLILAGIKSVGLWDPEPATPAHLSSQFYLGPASVGTPRAAACIAQLKELNQYVDVTLVTEPLGEDLVKVK